MDIIAYIQTMNKNLYNTKTYLRKQKSFYTKRKSCFLLSVKTSEREDWERKNVKVGVGTPLIAPTLSYHNPAPIIVATVYTLPHPYVALCEESTHNPSDMAPPYVCIGTCERNILSIIRNYPLYTFMMFLALLVFIAH